MTAVPEPFVITVPEAMLTGLVSRATLRGQTWASWK